MRNTASRSLGILLAAAGLLLGCGGTPPHGSDNDAQPPADAQSRQDASDASDASARCTPGTLGCFGDHVATCTASGAWEVSQACGDDERCVEGSCLGRCAPELLGLTHLGCAFWAVDLDNEYLNQGTTPGLAASEQLAVLVSNPQTVAVEVQVFRNTAGFGEAVTEELVTSASVLPGDMARVDLPQREVDGSMGQNDSFEGNSGSGTFVSSHAYRILASAPVAAFQLNPIVDASSNDAALLLPEQVIGTRYTVMGWPTATPCGVDTMPIPSIPDHTSVTIVGVHPDTQVTVEVTHPVAASGGESGLAIPETPAGGQIVAIIGPYDVLNLESLQPVADSAACITLAPEFDGDFSGTRVTSSHPVLVFSSAERGAAQGGASPPPPPGWTGDSCCTDHLEEQLAPDVTLGWKFAVGRSPVRSTQNGYREPDIYRIVATANGTVVLTSLPSPFARFELDEGEVALLWAADGFTVESQGGAIVLGQYLQSGGFVLPAGRGDPAFLLIPPVEQMLPAFLVAVPGTYEDNSLVITYPVGASLALNGETLGTNTPGCLGASIGEIGASTYAQLTCRVTAQAHSVAASQPIHVSVFGYGALSSFAYAAGSAFEAINP